MTSFSGPMPPALSQCTCTWSCSDAWSSIESVNPKCPLHGCKCAILENLPDGQGAAFINPICPLHGGKDCTDAR